MPQRKYYRRRAPAKKRAAPARAMVPYQARIAAPPKAKPAGFGASMTRQIGSTLGGGFGNMALKAIKSGLGSLSKAAPGMGAGLGAGLLGPGGAGIGAALGGGVATLLDWMTGKGDYNLNNNSIIEGGMSPPQIINVHENHGIIVRHREYLGDINATTAFTIQQFPINPGQSTTFPWLAQIAGSYEEYRMRGLVFEFKSLSSDAVLSASTSSALGSVVMATQYNPNNPAFANKQQMENYEFANSSKPSCSFMHPVECDPKQTILDGKLFVRTTALPAGEDLRLSDLGNFSIATVGMQAASGVCGELWCTYEVEFWKAKFNPVSFGGQAGANDHFTLLTVANATPLGTTSTNSSNATLKGSITSGTTYNFPTNIVEGLYMFVYSVSGSTASITSPSITVSGGTIVTNGWNNATNPYISIPANSVSSSRFCQCWLVTVAASGCYVALGAAGTLPAVVTSGDLYVCSMETI